MVRSASDDGRRRKNTYLAISAIILSFAVYVDIVTGSRGEDGVNGASKSRSGEQNEFVPIFTTPTFIILVLVGIFNIGTREKWDSENDAMGGVSSAYSVFNRGGKAIMGTMSAKELDGQLRGGPVGGYGTENDEHSSETMGSGVIRKRLVQQERDEPSKVPNERRQEQLRRERAEAAMRRLNAS